MEKLELLEAAKAARAEQAQLRAEQENLFWEEKEMETYSTWGR